MSSTNAEQIYETHFHISKKYAIEFHKIFRLFIRKNQILDKPNEILVRARQARGYTQESLASAIGVTLRSIQNYEKGEFPKFRNDTIKAIDEKLGTNLYEAIYAAKDEKTPAKPGLDEDIDEYKRALRIIAMQAEANLKAPSDLQAILSRIAQLEQIVKSVHEGQLVVIHQLTELQNRLLHDAGEKDKKKAPGFERAKKDKD